MLLRRRFKYSFKTLFFQDWNDTPRRKLMNKISNFDSFPRIPCYLHEMSQPSQLSVCLRIIESLETASGEKNIWKRASQKLFEIFILKIEPSYVSSFEKYIRLYFDSCLIFVVDDVEIESQILFFFLLLLWKHMKSRLASNYNLYFETYMKRSSKPKKKNDW